MAQANVSTQILNNLSAGLQDCSSQIASLRGQVRARINECMGEARGIVARIEAQCNAARQQYDLCSRMYDICRRSQEYDEESGRYKPSCSCEERDMKNAKREYDKLSSILDSVKFRLNNMEFEMSSYEESGEKTMNSITDEYVPDATDRLMKLNDKVERYETLEIAGVDIGDSNSSTGVLSAPQNHTFSFKKGTERLRERMEKMSSSTSSAATPCVHCGKLPCECAMIRERLRLLRSNQR